LKAESQSLFSGTDLIFEKAATEPGGAVTIEDLTLGRSRSSRPRAEKTNPV
jgi:hypothetical protein